MAHSSDIDPELFVERLSAALRLWQGDRTNDVAANLLGISKSTYSRWIKGDNTPDVRELSRICRVLGMRPDALFGLRESSELVYTNPESDAIFYVPILDVSAAAGAGAINYDELVVGHVPFPHEFFRSVGVSPENARGLRSRGDSMLPTIPDDRLTLIDVADRDTSRGNIFLLRTPDGLRLKRVQRGVDGSITLISDNKDFYLPERLSPEDAKQTKVLGRAFWTDKLI